MKLEWNDPVDDVRGLGPKRSEFVKSQGFVTVGDLLLGAPLRFIDRRKSPPFIDLIHHQKEEITAVGQVESIGETGYGRKRRLIVNITDGIGHLQGVWFQQKFYRFVKSKIKPGQTVAFSGKVGFFDGPQMTHPQVSILDGQNDFIGTAGLIPIYPSGEKWDKVGLSRHIFPRLIRNLIQDWDGSGPYIPKEIIKRENLLSFTEAIDGLHNPDTPEQFDHALLSLKFSELFHHQLLMTALRRRRRRGDGIFLTKIGDFHNNFIQQLPFELSDSQKTTLTDFDFDFRSGSPMYRLLQGEVGAGKTVVALAAAAIVADNGYQTALMAPTELLARQHYQTAIKWCEPAGMKAVLISGGRSPDETRRALYEASVGGADLIIGTHSLFQERVEFSKLGMVIIDEQQRFGVRQRSRLVSKGKIRPHVLLMTATPIPRTLALAHYGDLDLSYLKPLEGKTRNVVTKVVSDHKRDTVFEWLRGEIKKGERAYLVFPVIDEGVAGLEAAEARFEPYQKIDFKSIPMALAHGRVPIEQRQRALEQFRNGEVKMLVATAVIEVGVDVPEANIMLIENSERFGLSQLHQLRGRIGRTGARAVCVLMTPESDGEQGFERLKLLVDCDNGLKLAEEDLKFRGAGEPLGAKQSGMIKFRLADLYTDLGLLSRTHKAAELLLDEYPDLAPFPELRKKLRQDYKNRPRTIMAG